MSDIVWRQGWSLADLAQGLSALAKLAGLADADAMMGDTIKPLALSDSADLARWIAYVAEHLGCEAEPVQTTLPEVAAMLANLGPGLLRLVDAEEQRFLLVIQATSRHVTVLSPDLSRQRIAVMTLRGRLCQRYEAPLQREIDHVLQQVNLSESRRRQVSALMLEEHLANQLIADCWLLRLSPAAGFWRQIKDAGLLQRVAWMVIIFLLLYGLEIGGWGLIGNAALEGRLDFGWLGGWGLLVLSLIPLHLLAGWLDARFALDMGRLLKKRLLTGALRLDLQTIQHQGAGQLLGRVLESQALEALALNGGFSVLVALIECGFAGWILAMGAGGALHVALMLLWLMVALLFCGRYFRHLRRWTLGRLDLTHTLVERMVGHKTCLAQEPALRRIGEEDQALDDYFQQSQQADSALLPIMGVLSRGWLIVALAGLLPAFVGQTTDAGAMAISLGGILLANRALSSIAGGLAAISRAAIAWQQVSALFHAAQRQSRSRAFLTTQQLQADSANSRGPLLMASDLVYRYQEQGGAVLQGLNLTINRGDRLLLQGASGGGKSTLASLLAGLRSANSGLLLLNGLDRFTLGDAWHQLASEAPQFHENHILGATLAFNLLMGRHWPPSEADLAEARALCDALGLGELLARMPSGMQQMVGETGWQLSHGERSRIFLARALLQHSQLTILDESFAALDPESLKKCLQHALRHSKTLLVIAHP